ncbi:MAG: polyketide synthase dehydratase domain-containing protein [Nannocystaceae bacterium]
MLTPALIAAAGAGGIAVGSLRRDDGAPGRLLVHLGQLWAAGVALPWASRTGQGPRADLPPTVFLRERYWVEAGPRVGDAADLGLSPGGHPLLGAKAALADGEGVLFTGRLALDDQPWLADHVVLGRFIVPGTVQLGLALAAAREVGCGAVSELTLAAPLAVEPRADRRLQLRVGRADAGGARAITLHSRLGDDPEAPWTLHAAGRLAAAAPEPPAVPPELEAWPPADAEPVDLEGLYRRLVAQGLVHGPTFLRIQACRRRGDALFVRVAMPEAPGFDPEAFGLPVLLDACLHALLLLGEGPDVLQLPFSWSEVAVYAAGARELRVQIEVRTGDGPEHVRLVAADASGQLVAHVGGLVVRQASAAQVQDALRSPVRDLYRLDWSAVTPPEPAASSSAWVLGGDGALAASLDLRHLPDVAALRGALDREVPERVILDATQAGAPGPEGDLAAEDAGVAARARGAAAQALTTIQALLAEPRLDRAALLWLTRGAVASGPGDRAEDLAHATLWGLVRSARGEHPGRILRLVDLDAGPAPPAPSGRTTSPSWRSAAGSSSPRAWSAPGPRTRPRARSLPGADGGPRGRHGPGHRRDRRARAGPRPAPGRAARGPAPPPDLPPRRRGPRDPGPGRRARGRRGPHVTVAACDAADAPRSPACWRRSPASARSGRSSISLASSTTA